MAIYCNALNTTLTYIAQYACMHMYVHTNSRFFEGEKFHELIVIRAIYVTGFS